MGLRGLFPNLTDYSNTARILAEYLFADYTSMAYTVSIVEFIETRIFTRQVKDLLTEDQYLGLQHVLLINPEAGSLIRNSGGLRKLRWSGSGRGKRGGIRVIYYYMTREGNVLMLFTYPKSHQDDLSKAQLKVLRKIVEEELL